MTPLFLNLANAAVKVSLGRLALDYMLQIGGSGYFRSAVAQEHLETGRLWRVPDAPEFSYSVHAAYSTRSSLDVIGRVRTGLRASVNADRARLS